jgi:hypothetical protein
MVFDHCCSVPDFNFLFSKCYGLLRIYVAKADATLFNKTSQVILVRNGDHTTITMSSDFEGDVKDFAMVVPVPVVLQQDMVRTVSSQLFATLDNYSSPRLVEYYDQNPCEPVIMYDSNISMKMEMAQSTSRGAVGR